MKRLLIVLGSKSDLPFLADAKRLFQKSHIEYEIKIISAHRNIRKIVEVFDLNSLGGKKIAVVLAVAHSVANLPAIIAGYLKSSPIHVIGVGNVKNDSDVIESLLSVISIPAGVPLLNSGVGKVGLHNAALACIKILQTEKASKTGALRK